MARSVVFMYTLIIAAMIALNLSLLWGIVIVVVCFLYQAILAHGRWEYRSTTTMTMALTRDLSRMAIFYIPLMVAIIQTQWFIVIALFIAYLINLNTAYQE